MIGKYEIQTQEELAEYLTKAGYQVTQATISRDIQGTEADKKKCSPIAENGVIWYCRPEIPFSDNYIAYFAAMGFCLWIWHRICWWSETVITGMAMAVAAALDAIHFHEIVGCIAGDNTILCAVHSVDDTIMVMGKIHKLMSGQEG